MAYGPGRRGAGNDDGLPHDYASLPPGLVDLVDRSRSSMPGSPHLTG